MTNGTGADPNPRRLYRDKQNGILGGVCAGIADYFGFSLTALRVITFLAFMFVPPATLFCYIAAVFLVPRKPAGMYRSEKEELFWRSVRRDPKYVFDDVRHRFRDLDRRLQRMERYVTSPRFDLDRQFRDLER